ncbi:MAG: N-acetylgalactosamine 6-sulfate sulfatase, partial [Planctomycetota bacterium]
ADAKPLDGKSLVDLLSGESEDSLSERLLFSQWKTKSTVRSSKYRFHHTGELYDIESDPGEQADVSQQHPQVTERMSAALERWQRGTEQSNHVDPESRPFPLGHPAMRQTQLPARDAQFLGTIQRSNRWPNCSYLRHWTEPTDPIVWDVDVVEGGDFEVLMKYACLESSVGTRLELAGKNSSVSARVLTANPVGETGADDDLVPRMEGYVKDWATMSLGTIRLDAGAQQIRMSAPEIEGSEAVELRLLMFVRR